MAVIFPNKKLFNDMRKSIIMAAFAATLMLASCKSTTASLNNSNYSLAEKSYTLVELNGTPLEKVSETPTISFSKDRVNATVGCNQIFAEFSEQGGGKVTFGTGGMTRMMCPDVKREQEFVEAFNVVASYQVNASGTEVTFFDKDGKALFKAKK